MITFLLCTPRIVTFTDRYFQSWLFDQTEIPQIPQGVQKSVGTNQFSRPLRRLPSDRARSPAKQRPSASTCHVTNRLLEYRRASWSDSIHTWFREMTSSDHRGHTFADDEEHFSGLFTFPGHRILSPHGWNAEFRPIQSGLPVTKATDRAETSICLGTMAQSERKHHGNRFRVAF